MQMSSLRLDIYINYGGRKDEARRITRCTEEKIEMKEDGQRWLNLGFSLGEKSNKKSSHFKMLSFCLLTWSVGSIASLNVSCHNFIISFFI